MVTVLSSQAQNITPEQITGSWTLNYTATIENMKPEAKAKFDSMSLQRKSRVQGLYSNRAITLKSDNSYNLTLADGRQINGTWILKVGENMIEITDTKGLKHKQKVKAVNDNVLVLLPENIGKGTMLFSELHFSKN